MKEKVSSLIGDWYNRYKGNLVLKRFSTVLLVDVLARLSSIILLPLYLLLMTQEEYGLYNYILSIITTFSLILSFGQNVSQSKYYTDAKTKENKGIVLFNIFSLLSILLVLVSVPVYLLKWDFKLVALLFKNDISYHLYRLPILLAIIVSAYIVIISNYFITSEKIAAFRKYNIAKLILINAIVLFGLNFYRADTVFIRLTYTYSVELIILLVFSTYYVREMTFKINLPVMRNALKLGFPIMLSAIWGLFSNYSDKFFLEKYGTPKDLSYYYLAFSLSNIIYMICAAVQNTWLPLFLKERDLKKNIIATKKLVIRLVTGLLILSALLIVGFYIAIEVKMISVKYQPAIYILPILLLAQIINGIVLICSNYMVYFEKTQWVLFIGILTSLIGLLGGYYLVSIWNIFGAAISYLLVQIAYILAYYTIIKLKVNTYTQSVL